MISLVFGSICDAEQVWSEGRYPYENSPIDISFNKEIDNFSSDGMLKVQITTSYPLFQGDSSFIQKVNGQLYDNAKHMYSKYIQQVLEEQQGGEKFDEEAISMDFDKREISYFLTPTYASQRLVSIFGELHSYAGMPHGSSRYYAYNFWLDGKYVRKVSLESLFLPDKNFAKFIIRYCLSILEKERVGYFYPDPAGNPPVEIKEEDLNVFTLSKNGLKITFQPYHVGGWADGPYSVTIPFHILMPFIRFEGPLYEFCK